MELMEQIIYAKNFNKSNMYYYFLSNYSPH